MFRHHLLVLLMQVECEKRANTGVSGIPPQTCFRSADPDTRLFLPDFKNYYYSDACTGDKDPPSDPFLLLANATLNYTMNATSQIISNIASGGDDVNKLAATVICRRDSSLLFLLLMLGTVWVAITLYNFNKT